MRAPVGVQRCRRIGRLADGGQERAIRTLRVGDAFRRSLVGINHLVSPVPSQRPVSLDATDPDSRTRRHSGQAEGTEFQRNGERNGDPPSARIQTRERPVMVLHKVRNFYRRAFSSVKCCSRSRLSSGTAIGRTCQESSLE